MKKEIIELNEIKIVGISCVTDNVAEQDPKRAKIGSMVIRYFSEVVSKIKNRTNLDKTYCIYTKYRSDETGPYDYFIGSEVSSFEDVDELETLTIPKQRYARFDIGPGQMPNICANAWRKIWTLSPEELGGKRRYLADFEIYDDRAKDPSKAVFDIYIGIK